jgi:hypothetical protein
MAQLRVRLVSRGRFRLSLRFGPHKTQVDPKSCMPLISQGTAWVFLDPRLVTDMLMILVSGRATYLSLHEKRADRRRWLTDVSLQTADPSAEVDYGVAVTDLMFEVTPAAPPTSSSTDPPRSASPPGPTPTPPKSAPVHGLAATSLNL